jgi:hypothetical protein
LTVFYSLHSERDGYELSSGLTKLIDSITLIQNV